MKRKALSWLLALCMIVCLLPTAALAVDDEPGSEETEALEQPLNGEPGGEMSGDCGATESDSVKWTLTENDDELYCKTAVATSDYVFSRSSNDGAVSVTAYTLTISGSGAMKDYKQTNAPWLSTLADADKVNANDAEKKDLSHTVSPRITRVVFADDAALTHIGSHAFRSTSISTINLPDSVTSIGNYALIRCWNLEKIEIGGKATTTVTKDRSFYVTDGVLYENYTLEDGTSGVELRFYPAAKTTGTFNIPDDVTVLGANSMQDGQFTGLVIPNSVRSINSYALCHTRLISVTLPANVTFGTEREIGVTGAGVFSGSKQLESIANFPDVTTVPANMFASCSALQEFGIPSTVKAIERGAFDGSGITKFTIPASVQSIGDVAFARTGGEQGNVTVTFGEGSHLTSIGKNCFTDVAAYEATFDADDMAAYLVFTGAGYHATLEGKPLPEDENFVYAWAGKDELKIVGLTEAGKKATELTIPDTVTGTNYEVIAIADSVFAGTNSSAANTTLQKVEIGANIETIGAYAFRYCSALSTIDFSKATALKSIGASAFYYVAATEFDFSACSDLEKIGASAFQYDGVKTITLPNEVKSWGEKAINDVRGTIKCSEGSTTIQTLLGVLANKTDTFMIYGENDTFTYDVAVDANGKPCITIKGFSNSASDDAKKNVVIPDNISGIPVTAVAEKAFSSSHTAMQSISIGANVRTIGAWAFSTTGGNDTGSILKSVKFEEGAAVEIGQRAFQKHGQLETFDAGDRAITLGNNALLSASNLTTVNIPGVTSLGTGVFYGASKLTTLVINGEAKYAEETFMDVAIATGTNISFQKATVYVVGSADKATSQITALAKAGNTVLLANGGTVNVPVDKTGFEAVSKPGYTAKWYEYNGSTTDYSKEPNATPDRSKVYIAVWELDGNHVEITYAANDGSDATVTNVAEKEAETHVEDSLFTRSGYTFTVWNTSKDGNGTSYGAGGAITPTKSVTLYAQWELNKPTVTTSGDVNTTYVGKSVELKVKASHDADVTYSYQWKKDGSEIKGVADSTYTLNGDVADSGTYVCVVTATDKDGKTAKTEVSITVAISPASITGVTVNGYNGVYDADGHDAVTVTKPEDVKIQYKLDNGEYQDTIPTITNAGSYTVSYKVSKQNYIGYERTVTAEIQSATQSIDYAEKTVSKKAGDAAFTNELTKTTVFGTVTYASSDTAVATVDAQSGEVTIVGTGTATITATAAGDGTNYDAAAASYTLTVSRRSSGGSSSSGSTTYTVTTDSARNGSVSVSPKNASKGTTVTITVKPNSGYELDDLTVTDKNGDTVKLTRKSDTKYTFTMPASKVTVEASFTKVEEQPAVSFVDVPTSAYYYDAVAWAVENGITNGTSATAFSPDVSCTRAQMVTFLWRAAGSPKATGGNPFTDVSASAYYYDAVLWAVENGITNGTSATTFSPDDTVTRGQTVTFQHRAAGSPTVNGGSFADVAADAYYAPAVQWAVANGITNGTSNTTFSPDDPCTRGQIVTFMYRDAQ